ncbi:ABC transporter ATP-binding protein [Spongiactinospora sp. TRM90649]|uniref:dipeptide ABC transporter ATP-binding protein n=1 Tax=Spongiactinospora sp. TRM90649 TaxID=3031114 RepID=UPI0023F8C948|nr:ABC transporter ATP-binding protein [Spongiactinospora sp. TRM90649]MDF5759089.1 ABC transporter ATP-binding protein [Spongiactinospora sp. TRM90649]
MSLLNLTDLTIGVTREAEGVEERLELVHELSLDVDSGKTLCVVGESGSGKTVTALSIIRLLEFVAPVYTEGTIAVGGVDVTQLSAEEMRGYRGARIGMIFQEALDSLNPALRIGMQLMEAYRQDASLPGQALRRGSKHRAVAEAKARGLLAEVGLADTDRIMKAYPHQLSGGMQQRVMIAMALMSDPDILIADEPTTALDVTTQAEILTLFRRVQREHRTACVFITHDMGVAAEIADRIAVMYRGRLVEVGNKVDILTRPRHPYTRALLECVPQVGVSRRSGFPTISEAKLRAVTEGTAPAGMSVTETPTLPEAPAPAWGTPPLVIERVTKVYGGGSRFARRPPVRAVNEVSLEIAPGEFFGLVGESGSGKSTLGRMISALETPTSGTITFGAHQIGPSGLRGDERSFRRHTQLVFQDPQSSLDPRHTVARIVAEPLYELTRLRGGDIDRRVAELIDEVGLPADCAGKLPSQLSGGQRQRVSIARAVAAEPQLIVADEPTSALDVSVQGQVMNLLLQLRRAHGISFLFITHNLSLVLSVADRVGVMYQGDLIEVGTPAVIAGSSTHDYTRRLLAANPDLSINVGANG